jgi:tetratricopeptide (TPR) repeat protein
MLARAGFTAEARTLLGRLNSSDDEGPRIEMARAMFTAEIALAEGRIKEALVNLEEANRLAPPIQSRAFWAYGLERAGRVDDALIAWRQIAATPALLWTEIHDNAYNPGLWTEALLHVADLELRAKRKAEAREALEKFLKIREHADLDDPQSVAARELHALL